jgi:hypothetical protein
VPEESVERAVVERGKALRAEQSFINDIPKSNRADEEQIAGVCGARHKRRL